MKILAIDSSAKAASVAITDGGRLISECYVNAALTHSRTLMPMIDNALKQADLKFGDIDALAVNVGPGSFTGIRIGIAAAKGLAISSEKSCAGVSTLLSTAFNFIDDECILCVAMDARCNQVYTASFECGGGKILRLCEDKAISVSQLERELSSYVDKRIVLAGDGAELCFNAFYGKIENLHLAAENRRYQRAFGTAAAAENNNALFRPASQIVPIYLRLPQAERELKLRKGEKV